MKYLLVSLCLFICQPQLFAQDSYSTDSLKLAQVLEWLETKLTYNYYNIDDEEWWINRFTYNRGSETVTIKNISAPQLNAVSEKTYLQLNFKLKDLNPYTISIAENEKNTGRLVAGKTIRIGAYNQDKAIKKSRNGQLSSNISFIYISIPRHYEDSVSNYVQHIADQLKEAILLSTRVYPQQTTKETQTLIKNILSESQFRSAQTSWTLTNLYDDVLEVEVKNNSSMDDAKPQKKLFLRFLDTDLELTLINPGAQSQIIYLQQPDPERLQFSNESYQLTFLTLNEFSYTEKGQHFTFIRE